MVELAKASQGKEDCDSPGTIDYVRSVILCPRQGTRHTTVATNRKHDPHLEDKVAHSMEVLLWGWSTSPDGGTLNKL